MLLLAFTSKHCCANTALSWIILSTSARGTVFIIRGCTVCVRSMRTSAYLQFFVTFNAATSYRIRLHMCGMGPPSTPSSINRTATDPRCPQMSVYKTVLEYIQVVTELLTWLYCLKYIGVCFNVNYWKYKKIIHINLDRKSLASVELHLHSITGYFQAVQQFTCCNIRDGIRLTFFDTSADPISEFVYWY